MRRFDKMTKRGDKGRVFSLRPHGKTAFRQGQRTWFKLHARNNAYVSSILFGRREGRRKYLAWAKTLTDGEGLEIFWSLFRRSIPPGPILKYFTKIKATELALGDAKLEKVKRISRTKKGRSRIVSQLAECANLVTALAEEIPPPQSGKSYWDCRRYLVDLSIALTGKNDVESHALKRAVEIIEKHRDIPIGIDPAFEASNYLRLLCNRVREMRPPVTGRPRQIELRTMAAFLAEYFAERSGNPLPEYVGKLIRLAFPEKWNPAGDIKEAAKKLIRWRSPPVAET